MSSYNISPRTNHATGVQSSEAFTCHDRRIGATTYRLVRHWSVGYSLPGQVGIAVYRVTRNAHGETSVTLVREFGRPLPKNGW
jgi:hypothetical protein